MSNNNSKSNNNNNNYPNQNYGNYNQNEYNGQTNYNNQYENYNNQGYQEGYNQQYQNNNEQGYQDGYNQQYQNNQQYDYSNQNYQNNNQYNYGNQQNNNQQYQNYPGSTNNLQYQNYNNVNSQQSHNNQYQNYNNPGQNQQNNQNDRQFYQNNRLNNPQGFNPNKKKKSKLVPIVSSILGVVLLSGGGLYYYSKSTNKPISSIFSFGKKSDEELYTPVLEKYKKAMDSGEVKSDSEVNNFAIENYNAKGKNKDYIRYVYYDIDGNGRNELLICDKDNLNSPFAIYSDNSNNVNLIYQVESGNDISKTIFYNDKSIWIHDTSSNNDTYVVYKLKDDGSKFEKVHDINFAEYKKLNKKFKDSISSEEFGSKDEFFKKYGIPTDKIDFSKLGYKALYYYNDPNAQEEKQNDSNNNNNEKKDENKAEFTNSQLALIGRALLRDSTSPENILTHYETGFIMEEQQGFLITHLGTESSKVIVKKVDNGIEILAADADTPAARRNYVVKKKATYQEIKDKFKKEDMDKINKIIEEYKHTRNYEKGQFNIKD